MKVVPSPSTNLYERSMSALLSTFKGQFEQEEITESQPAMDYIVGSFLDSLGHGKPIDIPVSRGIKEVHQGSHQSNNSYQGSHGNSLAHTSGMDLSASTMDISNLNQMTHTQSMIPSIQNLQQDSFLFDNRPASVPLERSMYSGWKDSSLTMPTPSASPLPVLDDRRFSEFTQYDGSQADSHMNMINRRMSSNTSHSSPHVHMESLPSQDYYFQEFRPSQSQYMYNDSNNTMHEIGSKFVAYQHPSVMSSNQDRIFRCDFPNCNKEFQKKSNLDQHRNIHLGKLKEKPFQCDKCPQAFARSHGRIY